MLANQGEENKKKEEEKKMFLSLTVLSAPLHTEAQCHLFQPYKP